MLATSANRNVTILDNIIQSLQQIKVSGQANKPIAIDTVNVSINPAEGFETLSYSQFEELSLLQFESLNTGPTITYTASFYSDEARVTLLFSDTSAASPSKFFVVSGRVFYAPSDVGLNDNTTLSVTKSQPTYYLTVSSSAGLNKALIYDNSANLMFRSVIVSTKPNPKFTMNANQAIVVPLGERQINIAVSGLHGHIINSYDLYLQQAIFDWANLSEQNRLQAQMTMLNLIRNTLYADRYRNSTCTLYNADLNGTLVKDFTPLASDALLRGVVRVDCVCWTDGDSLF